jgi:hypothetical protein
MSSLSINSTFIVPTSLMFVASAHPPFLMEVDPVGRNQHSKPFGPSSAFSMDGDAAIFFSSSRETTKTSNWPLVFYGLYIPL